VDTTITVRCACGWEASGPEDVVVAATVEHGRRVHNMDATRDQVLAMAIPAVESAEPAIEPSRHSPR
jgi:predicted small metal-binding protein